MQPDNLFEVLKQVITSWQTIGAAVVIFLFLKIVSHVSKSYHKPRSIKIKKPNIFKKKEPAAAPENLEELPVSDSNDELGLEED